MPDSENENGRTHEPSFRELVAEIDGLKTWISAELRSFDKLMGERDRRYSETASSAQRAAERVDERIEDLKKAFENYQTLQSQEIRSLRESRSEEQGHGSGISQSWAIVAVVAALIIDVGARFIR